MGAGGARVHYTANPSAEWTAQQIVEAFPWADAPRFLLRDRDSIYGTHFRRRMYGLRIQEIMIAPRSPLQFSSAGLPRVDSLFAV